MGNIAFIGLPRYGLSGLASGATSPATMPLTKLSDWEAWSKARLLSVDPLKTYVESVSTMPLGYYGPTPRVGGIAWAGHSLYLGATARSILLSSAAGTHIPLQMLPTSTESVSNMSGGFADVDDADPYSPDGNKMTNTGVPACGTRLGFGTPARAPQVGAERQLFLVRVSYESAPVALSVYLYESGVLRAQLSTSYAGGPTIQASGAVLIIPWDASLLQTADGSAVEISITATHTTSGEFHIEAVEWLCDGGPSSASILGDTGWLPAAMDQYDAAWGDTVSGAVGVAPNQALVHVFNSNIAGAAKQVTYFRDPLNAAGYIDLGEKVVGPQFVPGINRDWGSLVKLVGRDTAAEGESGSSWGVRREPLRQMQVPLGWLTKAEAHSLLERLWRAGTLTPFIAATFPDDPLEGRHANLYVRCTGLPDLSGSNVDYRSMSIELTEKR